MTYKPLYSLIIFLFSSTLAYPHVNLDNPKGGEAFAHASEITIKWSIAVDHGDNNWDLYYSLDGGDVWKEIELDIDKSVREYSWEMPSIEASAARIRIVQDNADYTDYDDESKNFSISNDAPPIEPDPEPEVITAIDNVDLESRTVIMLSNFPNPFSAQITIQFSLLKESYVKLNIYNLQGRLVSELVNARKDEGSYDVLWRNHGFSGGVYLCKLHVDEQKFTRKIVLNP